MGDHAMKKRNVFLSLLIAVLTAFSAITICLCIYLSPVTEAVGFSYSPMFMASVDNEETVPASEYGGISYAYDLTLPKALSNYEFMYLTFHLHHCYSSVVIDGEGTGPWNRKENESFHIGHTPGNYWHSIPVTSEDAGKNVRVTVTPVYNSFYTYEEPQFILTDRFMSLYMEAHTGLLPMLLYLAAMICGLVICIMAAFLPFALKDRYRIVTLGGITFLAGLWKLMGSRLLPLIFSVYSCTFYYVGITAYFVMLPLSAYFVLSLGKRSTGGLRTLLPKASALLTLFVFVMQLFGVFELHDVIVPVTTINIVLLFVVAVSGREKVKGRLIALLLPSALCADLLSFIIVGNSSKMYFMIAIVLILLFTKGILFVRDGIKHDAELRDVKAKALMNQITPHFIFNILTSVYYLCDGDPEDAKKALKSFSTYLKTNYTSVNIDHPVPFEQEISHTKAYLDVEQIRFNNSINVEWKTAWTDFTLPPLTLQPIVENAVKHTVGEGLDRVHIVIESCRKDGQTVVTVSDDGKGFSNAATGEVSEDGSIHTGLENVRRRIELMSNGKLLIETSAGAGTKVVICL